MVLVVAMSPHLTGHNCNCVPLVSLVLPAIYTCDLHLLDATPPLSSPARLNTVFPLYGCRPCLRHAAALRNRSSCCVMGFMHSCKSKEVPAAKQSESASAAANSG